MSEQRGIAERRRTPKWSLTWSSTATAERSSAAETQFRARLASLGLEGETTGDLPGFHFERESGSSVGEGAVINAYWASGGGRIFGVVRSWSPSTQSFDLDIVHERDGLTYRTYLWHFESLPNDRCLEHLEVKVYTPLRPLVLLRTVILWPFSRKLAEHAISGQY